MNYRHATRTWTGALTTAGLMLALAAIPAAAQSVASSSAQTQEDKATPRTAGEKVTDAWILTKVKSQFVGEDALENSDIDVDVSNHIVTLRGTVTSEAGKKRAAEIARTTEGVTRVDNRLTIGTAASTAKEAAREAKESTRDAKKEADEYARDVKKDAKESAAETKQEAKEAARETKEEAKEAARETKEDVKESTRTAKDKASETTREAREEAKETAHDTKESARGATGTAGAAVTDSWITTKVKSSFVGVDALEGSDIDVDTKDHIVTLRGTVPTENAKNRAVAIAKKIDGVQSVKSELTVGAKK